jgi:hypothetical protein
LSKPQGKGAFQHFQTFNREAHMGGFDLQHWTSIGDLNRGKFLGSLASRRRVPVFGSRLAGGTPALPRGSWEGRTTAAPNGLQFHPMNPGFYAFFLSTEAFGVGGCG